MMGVDGVGGSGGRVPLLSGAHAAPCLYTRLPPPRSACATPAPLLACRRCTHTTPHHRFHIMGGECNYLLRVARGGGGASSSSGAAAAAAAGSSADCRLEFVPDAEWQSALMRGWSEADCAALLDAAEALLLEGAHRLRLPVEVVRKERACGVIPTAPTVYEVLEELALTVQHQLAAPLPFCAFNGGNDVFVDVGNKSLGLEALMAHLGFTPAQVRVRVRVPCVWGGRGEVGGEGLRIPVSPSPQCPVLAPATFPGRCPPTQFPRARPNAPPPPHHTPHTHTHPCTRRCCTSATASPRAATTRPRATAAPSCGWPTRRRQVCEQGAGSRVEWVDD